MIDLIESWRDFSDSNMLVSSSGCSSVMRRNPSSSWWVLFISFEVIKINVFSNTDTYTKERKTSKNREIHGDNEQRRCKRQKQTKKKKRKWQETQKKICSVVLNLHCVFKACIQFCFISCVVLWREFSWIWKINIIRRCLSRYYWE